ncbi:MAG: mycofactocin system transcriptional regulator [Frankiales bacterium]|nr:mycofactocin system transcriptional regulator [Frankiales bacterium]
MPMPDDPRPTARPGRPAVTSRSELEQVALGLFRERGFEATTVDDLAEAAGIGRRTFFRYYASKNDVVWGDFETGLAELRRHLDEDEGRPLLEALRRGVLAFNTVPVEHLEDHRQRMALILHVPALQAHSTLRYAAWRAVVADYAARRLAQPASSLLPQLVGHTCLGAALTAYEQWLADRESDLTALLDEALSALDGRWADAPVTPSRRRTGAS